MGLAGWVVIGIVAGNVAFILVLWLIVRFENRGAKETVNILIPILTFAAGSAVGALLMGLCCAQRRDEKRKRWWDE